MSSPTPSSAGPVHETAILAIVLISFFMVILDNSIIFTGLPAIRDSFGFSDGALVWVQDAYTLTFGGLLLLAARAADILGRKRLFIIGLVIFTVASILIGIAGDGGLMIAARALQGIGSAIVAPTSLALLTATFEEGPARNRAVTLYAAVAGIGASVGLVLGGATVEIISWRAGFLLNVPIGIVMLVLAARYLRELPRTPGRFDVLGAVTATLGMTALIYGIVNSSIEGWTAPLTIGGIIAGVVLLVVFVINEWRAPQPILPLHLFASATRSGSYLVRMLYMGAFIAFFYFTTQYLQLVLGWSALEAGLGFLPMTIVNFVVAMAVGPVVRSIGSVATLSLGVISTLAGMAWLATLQESSDFVIALALPMVLIGAGQGLALAPMTSYGLDGVRAEDAGAASGVVNTAQQLGLSLGLAILVALATGGAHGAAQSTEEVLSTVRIGLTGATVMLVLATLITLLVILPAVVRSRRTTTAG